MNPRRPSSHRGSLDTLRHRASTYWRLASERPAEAPTDRWAGGRISWGGHAAGRLHDRDAQDCDG